MLVSKPEKDQQQLENYIIISILNFIYKIFNKYIKNKLNSIIDTKEINPKNSLALELWFVQTTDEFAVYNAGKQF